MKCNFSKFSPEPGEPSNAKTPVPRTDGDRALSSIVLSESNRFQGVAISGTFEFQSSQRSNLEPLA
jgi:hypothetical protein